MLRAMQINDPSKLGPTLKALRKAAGLSQQAIGDAIGVNKAQVSNVELGQSTTTAERLIAWINACGATMKIGIRVDRAEAEARIQEALSTLDDAEVAAWADTITRYASGRQDPRPEALTDALARLGGEEVDEWIELIATLGKLPADRRRIALQVARAAAGSGAVRQT